MPVVEAASGSWTPNYANIFSDLPTTAPATQTSNVPGVVTPGTPGTPAGTPLGNMQASGLNVLNMIGQNLMPYLGALQGLTWPQLEQYSQYLTGMTSTDPTQRMAAAGPAIGDISKLTQGTLSSLSNLPRGGQQDYLKAQALQGQQGQIGDIMTNLYTQARGAQGQFGEAGIGQFLSGLEQAQMGWGNAANIFGQLADLKGKQSDSVLGAIGSIVARVASGGLFG